jgi:hypothetical protein
MKKLLLVAILLAVETVPVLAQTPREQMLIEDVKKELGAFGFAIEQEPSIKANLVDMGNVICEYYSAYQSQLPDATDDEMKSYLKENVKDYAAQMFGRDKQEMVDFVSYLNDVVITSVEHTNYCSANTTI